jgi:uncharacterized protein YneF (UPF0154 family)
MILFGVIQGLYIRPRQTKQDTNTLPDD